MKKLPSFLSFFPHRNILLSDRNVGAQDPPQASFNLVTLSAGPLRVVWVLCVVPSTLLTLSLVIVGHQLAISPHTENFSANWLGEEVTGATLGIIGMGSIGYKIAQRARAFEMKILYHNRKRR